jgi:hypothetical protein
VAKNNQLRQLFEEDQAIRRARTGNGPPSLGLVLRFLWSDARRRRGLRRLMRSGALKTGEDYYHAAMLLQHSPRVRDYWQAHQLAGRAVELGHRPARWLVAASLDRWLLAQRQPQKYGTQYVPAGRPRWMWRSWWAWWGVRQVRLWDRPPGADLRLDGLAGNAASRCRRHRPAAFSGAKLGVCRRLGDDGVS